MITADQIRKADDAAFNGIYIGGYFFATFVNNDDDTGARLYHTMWTGSSSDYNSPGPVYTDQEIADFCNQKKLPITEITSENPYYN